jgi:hypothetical protein
VHGAEGAELAGAGEAVHQDLVVAMMAFLYAMKCLKLLTPCSFVSAPMSACTVSSHQVIATWKE